MAIAKIQGPYKGSCGTGTSFDVTLGATPTKGNLLVCCVGSYINAAYVCNGITQANVTWTKQIEQSELIGSGWYCDLQIWIGVVGINGGKSITVSFSGTIYAIADVSEFSGINALDVYVNTKYNTGANSSCDTGTTPTTTYPNELWIGCCMSDNSADYSNPTNGFTMQDGTHIVTGTVLGVFWLIVSSTGTAQSGANISNPQWYVGLMATFFGTILGISGKTYDQNGAILGGCTVNLYRADSGVFVAQTTSDASTGIYTFTNVCVEGVDYFVVAFKAGSPDVFGCTDDTLVGS